MRLVLEEPFKRLWSGRDPFEAVEALQGKVYRELEGRRTLRTEVDGRGYFVKIHRGIGWGEIAKNLLTAKLPVLGARQEWQAIRRLHEAGVATMTAVAYGERGSDPARQHSFIVTEELAPTVDLEVFSRTGANVLHRRGSSARWSRRWRGWSATCTVPESTIATATSVISCCTPTSR